jgi:hypothetical protein
MFSRSSTSILQTCNIPTTAVELVARKVDVRLPGKGNLNFHNARPVHLIIIMKEWIRTSRLSIKNSLSEVMDTALSSIGSLEKEACPRYVISRHPA